MGEVGRARGQGKGTCHWVGSRPPTPTGAWIPRGLCKELYKHPPEPRQPAEHSERTPFAGSPCPGTRSLSTLPLLLQRARSGKMLQNSKLNSKHIEACRGRKHLNTIGKCWQTMKVEFGGFQALPRCEEMWLLQGCPQAGPSLAVCRAPSHPSNPPSPGPGAGEEGHCASATGASCKPLGSPEGHIAWTRPCLGSAGLFVSLCFWPPF